MSTKKKVLAAALAALLLVSLAGGMVWYGTRHFFIGFRAYPREATYLDLRGSSVSLSQYDRLRQRLPDCEILWDVPFQDGVLSPDIQVLKVTRLEEKDLRAIGYLPCLEVVEAEDCRDYSQLIALGQHYPHVEVRYAVSLGGDSFPSDSRQLQLRSVELEQIPDLQYLPDLTTVVVSGGENMENFSQLQDYCRDHGISFCVRLGSQVFSTNERAVQAAGVTDSELSLLTLLPKLEQLALSCPKASPESLEAFRVANPQVDLTWEQTLGGSLWPWDQKEFDLTGKKVSGAAALEAAMAYFPKAEKIIVDDRSLDNETLAAWRDRAREHYKVVWTVQCGSKLTCRTDAESFMPVRENVYYFNDEEAYNLRYCEDMIALDVGHMSIHDVSFVEHMPKLQYLILAHTQVQDISPLRSCKQLKFLELDWSPVRDFSPLEDCTALEDLNVGKTYAKVDPLKKMTWLKNLWMVGRGSSAWPVTEALTNTKVVASGSATVAGGWRDLPNYYAMRDVLGMHYMSW